MLSGRGHIDGSVEDQNVATVMSYYERLQKSDRAGMAEFLAPELIYRVYSNSPYAGRYSRDDFLAILPTFFERQAAPLHFDFIDVTAQGDRVCVFARGRMPLKSGDQYDNMYHYLFRLRDHKIVEIKEVYARYGDF